MSASVFLDANIFLRHLIMDHPRQAPKATELLGLAAEGKVRLVTGPPVLFEVAWSLRRGYGRSRGEVQDTLEGILAMAGLDMMDAPLVRRALQLGRDHAMEFADAYIAASALAKHAQLATFNEREFRDSGVGLRSWS